MNKLQFLLGTSFFVSVGAAESDNLLPVIIAIGSAIAFKAIEKRKNTETGATISVSNDW